MNAIAEDVQCCSECNGRRTVWNKYQRRRIPCRLCGGMGTREAEQLVSELTAIERRRVERASRVIRAAVVVAFHENRNPALIADPRERVVDRVMQRWAVGHGSGMPPDDPGALEARPPPLDDRTQCVVDDIIDAAPKPIRHFIVQWYRTERSCRQMAEERGISIPALYERWKAVLEWLRLMFLAAKHSDLKRLLAML